MNQINVNSAPVLIQIIAHWVRQKDALMQRAWAQQGGWEGWAQVELGIYLQDALAAQRPVIKREQHFYEKSDLAADITIDGWHQAGGGPPHHLIELKCESQFQDVSPGAFADRYIKDTTKLKKQPLKSKYRGRRLWTIGITGNSKVADAMDKKLVKEKVSAHEVVINVAPGGPGFWGQASIWYSYIDV